jgi:hypothetical protein
VSERNEDKNVHRYAVEGKKMQKDGYIETRERVRGDTSRII